jgi:putative ABC transport system ATP-binding protein
MVMLKLPAHSQAQDQFTHLLVARSLTTDRSRPLPAPRPLGGQKRRVAIARALAGSAPILLADGPTANLDSQLGAQVLDLFRDLARREDRALLIVTHDPKVRGVADRVVQIRDGMISN